MTAEDRRRWAAARRVPRCPVCCSAMGGPSVLTACGATTIVSRHGTPVEYRGTPGKAGTAVRYRGLPNTCSSQGALAKTGRERVEEWKGGTSCQRHKQWRGAGASVGGVGSHVARGMCHPWARLGSAEREKRPPPWVPPVREHAAALRPLWVRRSRGSDAAAPCPRNSQAARDAAGIALWVLSVLYPCGRARSPDVQKRVSGLIYARGFELPRGVVMGEAWGNGKVAPCRPPSGA